MTWFSPVIISIENHFSGSIPGARVSWPTVSSLGSSVAGAWSWERDQPAEAIDTPHSTDSFEPEGVRLSAPPELLQRMASAARALGRSESDIWVEAAREWLLRHEPEGPTNGHADSVTRDEAARRCLARRSRSWRDIDHILCELRESSHVAEDSYACI
jgi:hypothetical protein